MIRFQVNPAFWHTSLTTFLQIQKVLLLSVNKKLDLVHLPPPIADDIQYNTKFYTEMGYYNIQISARGK